MHEHIKTIYTFEVYSNKGVDIVKAETTYKTIYDLRNEIEQAFKKRYNIKGSLIVQLVNTEKIYN